jgi:hypothetical protein
MDDSPSTRRSRRAVLGLTAGALASVAGCTSLGGSTNDDPDDEPTDTPTGDPSPTGRSPDGTPDDTPGETPAPGSIRLTDTSVQSTVFGRHVTGDFLSLGSTDGWLLFVALGTAERGTPGNTERAFRDAPGYPERGALELRVEGEREATYVEARRRNYRLVGDARGAWTAFAVPSGLEFTSGTVAWPAEDVTVGAVPEAALERLGDEPPAFTLESFVAGDPGTTPVPDPSPTESPTPTYDDHPTTTVDYELTVRNDGGDGTFRGYLDHETPRERFVADDSQGGQMVTAEVKGGETRTITGQYTVYYSEGDPVVPVRAVTTDAEATSHVETGA